MISVIVMASGYSRRMGRNKLLLPYNNKTIIENVLDNILQSGLKNIILVSRDENILEKGSIRNNVTPIYNPNALQGQSSSIKLGILNSPDCDGFMFATGDQPLLDLETLKLLVEAFENNKDKIIVPVFKGKNGNPVIFPASFKTDLLKLSGDSGGRSIIAKNIDKVLFIEVKNEYVLWDIDTEEDYDKLNKCINGNNNIVIVRGGGDIASGTIQKLFNSGFKVLVLEIENPMAIRRKVSFCEAVYDGTAVVESITAKLVKTVPEIEQCWNEDIVPVAIDPKGDFISILKPLVVVDAILAKENLGTNRAMAPITIALGPGFTAGKDVDVVIETMRGHNLGRLIFNGRAAENTGVPGVIGGYSAERVIHSPADGIIENIREIGDIVSKEEVIAKVSGVEVKSKIDGVLRGIIRNGSKVLKGTKIADVDPRLSELSNCFTITDKSRNIAGGVLEAILYLKNKKPHLL